MDFFHASHENYLIRMDFSQNYHASHEITLFVIIRMDFSRNCHASHEIISFVVIRMDFFHVSHENYLIRMDFSTKLSCFA